MRDTTAYSHRVLATREGLVGLPTSTGWIIDTVTPFVALPSTDALHRYVVVSNPLTAKTIRAQVLDVGPWNIHDDTYVFGQDRPLSESGVSFSNHGTNKAGIDLGEAVWNALGMKDNGYVIWWWSYDTPSKPNVT